MIVNDTSTTLSALAPKIRAAYAKAEQSARTTITYARDCGNLLLQAKELSRHGDWTGWVERNFPGTPRTAQRWMTIAENWGELSLKNDMVSFLGVADAIKQLTNPKTSEPLRLFAEYTILPDQSAVERVRKALRPFAPSYLPIIEYEAAKNWWVFHTLLCPGDAKVSKPVAMLFRARELDYPHSDLGELTAALALLRQDMGAGWVQHCIEKWGDVSWVNETIDVVNTAMANLAA